MYYIIADLTVSLGWKGDSRQLWMALDNSGNGNSIDPDCTQLYCDLQTVAFVLKGPPTGVQCRLMSQLEVQHHWKSWIQIVLENWQSSKILGSAASVTGTEKESQTMTLTNMRKI